MMSESGFFQVKYQIGGMDCSNCALILERSLGKLPGIEEVQVNFTLASLQASGSFDPQELQQRIHALGYQVLQDGASKTALAPAQSASVDGPLGFVHFLLSERHTTFVLVSALILLVVFLLSLVSGSLAYSWIQTVLNLGVVVLAGLPIASKGVRALFVGRQITIDLLMSIATLGALVIGESGEAATVILLFATGEALEGYSAERARRSLRNLLALKPDTAVVLRPCMDCAEHMGMEGYSGGACPFCEVHAVTLPVGEVAVGEIILVRPGELIPLDGRIQSGASAINQASVTGESLLVEKNAGECVYAGTLNGEGALEIEVTFPAQDSTISRIVRLVEQAQAKRAPVERFIDSFAAWYTPLVVSAAALLAVIPPVLFAQPFLDQADGTRGWLYRALALLIVACPCALVISTPVTVVSSLTNLARRGVLVKGGSFLDLLARVRVFAFDKTGTLTLGRPVVIQTRTLKCLPGQDRCVHCDDMLLLAAAVESRSGHPLAQAVLAETAVRQITHRIPSANQVVSLAGRGVRGQVNGSSLTLGSHAFGHENFSEHDNLHRQIEQAEASGQTVILVSKDDRVIGFVGVADMLRQTTQEVLVALKAIDPHYYTIMLTGDHPSAAERIASELPGLDEVRAGLLPEDKLDTVHSLQAEQGLVAMIGDGVNDAPALAAANVGIAMGGIGSAQAMETADIVLMQDDITHLPGLVLVSRRSRAIIWQNIAFSLAAKAVFMVLALPGWTTLWMAVFADMGASLLVTLNGMRMLNRE